MLHLSLSPSRQLHLKEIEGESLWPEARQQKALLKAFATGPGELLLELASEDASASRPPEFSWLASFGRTLLGELCHRQDATVPAELDPPPGWLDKQHAATPPFAGAEYAEPEWLSLLWKMTLRAAQEQQAASELDLAAWLRSLGGSWGRIGRVWFHLAENPKGGETRPFAFMATYATGTVTNGRLQFRPLGKALEEFAGAGQKAALSKLLATVAAAAAKIPWVQTLLDSGEIFQPILWSRDEAYAFLLSQESLESCGVMTQLPQKWLRRPAKIQGSVSIGTATDKSQLGAQGLIHCRFQLALDGSPLSRDEAAELLKGHDGLALIRGQWVQIDKAALQKIMDEWDGKAADGMSLNQALRLLAADEINPWLKFDAGEWLQERLSALSGEQESEWSPPAGLRAKLRPYQQRGVEWLRTLCQLRIGGCLADDMGLGKTLQVITLLAHMKEDPALLGSAPALVIAPTSLLGNWKAEMARFVPALTCHLAHAGYDGLNKPPPGIDVVLATYGGCTRLVWLKEGPWSLLVLDEAQAIKNPSSRQAKAVKDLPATCRIALSGTPVENRLGDLWSLFDFLNPGLLGPAKEFSTQAKIMAASPTGYAPLRRLISPWILRRMKTDKKIIDDLPDKVEIKVQAPLSRLQAALYQQAIDEMAQELENAEGIKRKGLVLKYLIRFKQICNHPDQWLRQGDFKMGDSGKFGRLMELAEEIASRGEKLLVFTQFQEMTEPLAKFLATIFDRQGLVLHGGTPIKDRKKMVDAFQADDGPPFFVLSIKAGGTGLTLTAANHVVHFDRWWNPAVENQATDRAFRIGQKKQVMVHKFLCRGTLEEKIDAMIDDKKALAEALVGDATADNSLSEMSTDELMSLVKLDLGQALAEEL